MVWVHQSNPSPLISSIFILHLLITITAFSLPSSPLLSNVQDNTNPTSQAPSSGLDDLDHDTPSSDWMMDHLASVDPNVQVHIIAPDITGDNLLLPPLPPLSPSPSIHIPAHPLPLHGSNDNSFKPAPPTWHSVTTNQPRRVRPLSLRHKPTMDWGMRARARNQIHWDKYWFQFEASRYDDDTKEEEGEASGEPHAGDSENDKSLAEDLDGTINSTSCSRPTRLYSADINSTDSTSSNISHDGIIPNSANGVLNTTTNFAGGSGCESMGTGGSPSNAPTSEDDDMGYFYFHQILNHFQKPSSAPGGESKGRLPQVTFRQYYQISSEFYKPGGPIILWNPGESPLHSLFLHRGLAYELANATSGLLVALEHRFYGNSIPRYQDSLTGGVYKHRSDFEMRTTRRKTRFHGQSDAMRAWLSTSRHHGIKSEPELSKLNAAPKIRTSEPRSSLSSPDGRIGGAGAGVVDGIPGAMNRQVWRKSKSKVINNGNGYSTAHSPSSTLVTPTPTSTYSTSLADAQPTPTTSTGKEGLPLDMLKYLTVDQAIEDIAYFMDNFPKLQPAYFAQPKPEAQTSPVNAPPKPNLRTNTTRWILTGCSYSGNLAAWTRQRYPYKVFAAFASSAPVRSALDFFEYTSSQTDILGKQCSSNLSLARDFLDSALQMTDEFMGHMALDTHGDDLSENKDNATVTFDVSPIQPVDGEVNNSTLPLSNKAKDLHARQAAKLKVLSWFSPDFARDYALDGEEAHAAGWVWWTVASAVQYNTVISPPSSAIGMVPRTTVDILCDTMALAHSSSPESSVSPIRYAKALATWFKDQQYFTPTKTEDLQPSDLDPNSVQNLAGIAWLWQTCSELGYLQTAHPSSCCCPPSSLPLAEALMTSYGANTFAGGSTALNLGNSVRNLTTTCGWDEVAMFSGDELSYPAVCKTLAPSHDQTMRMEGTVTTSQASTCQPCQCYATNTAKDESVFSRLLTLEAAWQDCQLYFGNSKGGTGIYSAASAPSPQPGVSGDGSYGAKTIVDDNAHPNPLLTLSQSQSSSSSCLKQPSLLKGYPDVEHNVNQKFHGWEIAQDPDPLPKQTHEDQHLFDDPVMTLIQQGQPPSHPLLQPSSQIHHSGRYYFTNGENDPWKELTLASAKAQEYLRIHRVATSRRPRPAEQDPSGILSESFLRSRTRTHHHRHRKPRHHHRRNRSDRHVLPQELVERLPEPDSQPEDVENAKETNTEDKSDAMAGDTQEREQNVIRIIPGASHCQDILYESTDQSSVALWTERQLVLKTFVQWIENDIRREKLEMMS